MTRYAFLFDAASCSGCKACQMACKDAHHLELGRLWRRVYEVTGGGWVRRGAAWEPQVTAYFFSISCNHCEQAFCLASCPARAISRRSDGLVIINADQCMGCGYCSWVCPFDAPQFDPASGTMTKCDFCADRLDQGQRPICVDACPMRALDFGDLETLRSRYGESWIEPLPHYPELEPAIIVLPHKKALPVGAGVMDYANREEV